MFVNFYLRLEIANEINWRQTIQRTIKVPLPLPLPTI